MREYMVTVDVPFREKHIRQTFKTLEEAIVEMGERLKAINSLDMLDAGKFHTTEIFDQQFEKTYIIDVEMPRTRIWLKKRSPGSWSKVEVLDKLTYIKKQMEEKSERI